MENEKRLIDANAFAECLERMTKTAYPNLFPGLLEAIDYVKDFPTVDAVEVVGCKDCKSWEQYNACDGTKPHRCMNHDAIFYKRTKPDDFCSYGERKDNGTPESIE